MITVAAAAVAHLMLVGGWMLALGHPLVGPFEAAGLVLAGAAPAWLHTRWRLWWPIAAAGTALLAASALELALPGPTVAMLGAERLTTGVPVLAGYASTWQLVLALALLSGLTEHARRQATRPRWTWTLGGAAASALVLAGLVLLAGLARGWATAPPPALSWGWPGLLVLGLAVALPVIRRGLVTPALVLCAALAVAATASWLQPLGDAVAGLLGAAYFYSVWAVLLAAVELLVRAVTRLARRPPRWRKSRSASVGASAAARS